MSYMPMSETLYTMSSSKPGDTLLADKITEQAFVSGFTVVGDKFNSIGQNLTVRGCGTFRTTSISSPSQNPKVKFGPAGNSLASRATVADGGPLNLILGQIDKLYEYTVDITIRSLGTSATAYCWAKLFFTTADTGSSAPYLAGPNGPGSGGLITFNSKIDNFFCLTDTFNVVMNNNNNILQTMRADLFTPTPTS